MSWLQRGTLHLVAAGDYWWLHPSMKRNGAAAPPGGGVAGAGDAGRRGRRRGHRGGAPDPGRAAGAARRGRVPTAGQALVHVLVAASVQGQVVRGPVVDGEHAFVSAPTWLGPSPAPVDRDEALARLARRYLVGHGPASDRDLAKWAGLPLGDARARLAGHRARHGAGGRGRRSSSMSLTAARRPRSRRRACSDPRPATCTAGRSASSSAGLTRWWWRGTGLFQPVALVDGHVVATWRLAGGRVTIALLEPVADTPRFAALERDAAEVLRYLGLPDTPVVVGDR